VRVRIAWLENLDHKNGSIALLVFLSLPWYMDPCSMDMQSSISVTAHDFD